MLPTAMAIGTAQGSMSTSQAATKVSIDSGNDGTDTGSTSSNGGGSSNACSEYVMSYEGVYPTMTCVEVPDLDKTCKFWHAGANFC